MKNVTLLAQNCKMTIREPNPEKDGTCFGLVEFYVDDIRVEEWVYRLALDTERLHLAAEGVAP